MKYPPNVQPSTTAPHFDGSQACAGADVDMFFPAPGAHAKTAVRQAKELCASCAFIAPCLEYAIEHWEMGVWGHTTEKERKALRISRGRRNLTAVAA